MQHLRSLLRSAALLIAATFVASCNSNSDLPANGAPNGGDDPSPPTLASVAPQSGLEIGGTTVTLTGTNFLDGATVTLGDLACANVQTVSPTTITCETPAGAVGPAGFTVTTTGGTATLADAFTYFDADPTLLGISPATGSEVGGTTITLTGGNFLGTVTVTIGGHPATDVTVEDAETVTAVAPDGAIGNADVVVTTAHGSATLTDGYAFTAASLYAVNGTAARWSAHGLNDSGDTPPARSVAGNLSQMSTPSALFVANDKVYVGDVINQCVLAFDANATGNVAPTQSISGGATEVAMPYGLYVDLQRAEIVIADVMGRVTVHDLDSDGDVAPLRVLAGASTGLSTPAGVWAHGGELFVANLSGNSITVYGQTDSGNAVPRRTISGVATGLNTPRNLCIANSELFVVNASTPSITVYPITANGNVAPTRVLSGAQTGMNQPQGVFATPNELFVANNGSGGVTVYPITATGDVAPSRTLAGASTGLSALRGIAVR